jgi:hypothetical protein
MSSRISRFPLLGRVGDHDCHIASIPGLVGPTRGGVEIYEFSVVFDEPTKTAIEHLDPHATELAGAEGPGRGGRVQRGHAPGIGASGREVAPTLLRAR